MLPVKSEPKSQTARQPRVLVVDDEPGLAEMIGEIVLRQVDCRIVAARTLDQARTILAEGPIEVLVTDLHLPDGDGLSLLPALRDCQPCASAIVITGSPSIDRAVDALRGGVVDFVTKPFSNEDLIDRVRCAIDRHLQSAKREKRIDRLRETVKRLNDSRKLISKKVDLLCNDLVGAYGELSRQLDDLRNQEGFRKYIINVKDLEQLLCHSMDWLLREIGYSNVAVFLAADDGVFQLGAYMKYTVPGDARVTEALRRVIVPMAVKDAVVRVQSDKLGDKLSPQELAMLKGQELLGVNCTYLGESLASLIFFRGQTEPFNDDHVELLKQVGPIFAHELASVVRDEQREENPFSEGDEPENVQEKPKRRPRKDPADWWKTGGQPPF